MSAILLDGKALSERLAQEQIERARALVARGIQPCLAVVWVGEDQASAIYIRNKQRECERLGIRSVLVHLPQNVSQAALHAQLDCLNDDPAVHGVLVQLPLPRHLDEHAALLRIRAEKDVDGFHVLNSGLLLQGQPRTLPCTPKGILRLLRDAEVPLDGAHAVIVGRSNIVGKPLSLMLLMENCTVTVCHTHTRALASLTRQADVLVSAAGRANLITADMVKSGAAVVDVGMNRVDGKLRGDVDFAAVSEKAGWITPVPGGVGPMTVRMLMENTLEAACRG